MRVQIVLDESGLLWITLYSTKGVNDCKFHIGIGEAILVNTQQFPIKRTAKRQKCVLFSIFEKKVCF